MFHVCHVLNSAVWPDLTKDSNEDEIKLSLQLNAIREIYEKYKSVSLFKSTSLQSLQKGYIEFVCYAYHYFDINNVKPADLWPKLRRLGKEREDWKSIILLIELCRCTPFSNATLEMFFSHFKFIKTEVRPRLSNKSSNSIMRIKMKNLLIFNMSFFCDIWYQSKPSKEIFPKAHWSEFKVVNFS